MNAKRVLFLVLVMTAVTFAQQAPAPPATPQGIEANVEAYVRKLYAWGPAFTVKVGKPENSDLPGFYRITIEVSVGGQSDTATMHISKDGRHLLRGDVLDTSVDPFAANRKLISVEGRPGRGPADAKIVVVDFSDFQCPHCRQLDQSLRQIVPQYPQVRFVSKHFPLEHIHPWAVTAAIAAECSFRLKPEAYWKVHDGIFDQQEEIKPDNAWQKIMAIGVAAGVDETDLRTCMVSPEAKQAVEQDVKDGNAARIANTPTIFINGRRLVGVDPNLIRQYLDYELSAAGGKP